MRDREGVDEALRDAKEDADRALADALPILQRLAAALSLSEASSLAAEITGVSRKALYAEALRMRSEGGRPGGD